MAACGIPGPGSGALCRAGDVNDKTGRTRAAGAGLWQTAVMAGKPVSAAGHFGRQMRKERLAHGWSLPEFSARIGFDAGHLSRVENARRPPTEALARACDGAFPERRGWFLDWYEESRHWAEVPAGFRSWAELEDKAQRLHDWMPSIITGLLQTEDYARALLETYPGVTDDAVKSRLAARMERQRRGLRRDYDGPDAPAVRDSSHAERHAPGASADRPPRDGVRLRPCRWLGIRRARDERVRHHR
jgi:transcriptional regulator with XRE-family HTH domain